MHQPERSDAFYSSFARPSPRDAPEQPPVCHSSLSIHDSDNFYSEFSRGAAHLGSSVHEFDPPTEDEAVDPENAAHEKSPEEYSQADFEAERTAYEKATISDSKARKFFTPAGVHDILRMECC